MRRIAVVNTGASTLKLVLVEVDDIHLREIERAHYDWEPDTNRADVLRSALERFFEFSAGRHEETRRVPGASGTTALRTGGAAHVVAYVGHNGLMDFQMRETPSEKDGAPPRAAIVLACKSRSYFANALGRSGALPLVTTTGLMAPEAYSLDAALGGWFSGETPLQTRRLSARAYARYQKCGVRAAERLFGVPAP